MRQPNFARWWEIDYSVKKCNKCGVSKELDLLVKSKDAPLWRRPLCKDCRNTIIKEKLRNNPESRKRKNEICKNSREKRLKNDPEEFRKKHNESSRIYKAKNREKINRQNKEYKKKNRETVRQKANEYTANNKEACNERSRRYSKENRDKRNALCKKYKLAKINRTPDWAIEDIIKVYYYMSNKMTEIIKVGYTVDHIIPLQWKIVSWLHTHTNLQVMKWSDNYSKNNKF